MDPLSLTIGRNIKRMRKKHQMMQKELAERIYCTSSSVCHWEKGLTQPQAFFFKKMAEVFNCSIDEFFREGGEADD